MLRAALEDLLRQYRAEVDVRGDVTNFELPYERAPDFIAILRAAHSAASQEVDGHPPVTAGFSLEVSAEAKRQDYKNASVNTRIWRPFVSKWFEKEARPRRHFHKSTLRQNDPRVALDDGKNLANITSLLNLASAAHLAPKLPRMHKEEEEVWQYEPAHGSLQEEAQGVLDILADKLITPIVEFAAQQPPVSPFDEQEQDWTRPDADDDIHKLPKRGSTGGGYAATMTSRNGVLTIYTKARRASGAVELENLPFDFSHLRPDAPPPSGASQTDAKQHRLLADISQPWQPYSTIADQGAHLADFLDSIDRALFLQLRTPLEQATARPSASKRFGQHFGGREALDAFSLLNLFIRLVASEELLTEEQAQELYAFAATSLALAALSPRPAIFAPLLPAILHDLQFELEEEERAGRLEMLLALIEQQYKAALLGLVQLTDSESFSTRDGPMRQEVANIATLFDLLVHDGVCVSCGHAAYALEQYQPKKARQQQMEDATRTLTWTTLSASRALTETVTQEIIYGRLGGEGWGYSLVGCAWEYEHFLPSFPSHLRILWADHFDRQNNNRTTSDKGTTTLSHKKCKVERGRTNAFKAVVSNAVTRGRDGAGEEESEAGGGD
ncbi:hypothetical protein JCM10296v2_004609 [Rhodotorula toruloides]